MCVYADRGQVMGRISGEGWWWGGFVINVGFTNEEELYSLWQQSCATHHCSTLPVPTRTQHPVPCFLKRRIVPLIKKIKLKKTPFL